MMRCLGRLPPAPAQLAAVPRFEHMLGSMPYSPRAIDWSRDIAPGTWGMGGNDIYSNCTAVAAAHAVIGWESFNPPIRFAALADILDLYSKTGGYVPGRPDTDQGARCVDVLNYWQRSGFQGVELRSFVSIDPQNPAHVLLALEAFGGLYTGVVLRQSQMDVEPGAGVWAADQTAIVGGHCVWVVGADNDGLTCVTWGTLQRMTWAFWAQAADELYGLVTPRWLAEGHAPTGWTEADISTIAKQLANA